MKPPARRDRCATESELRLFAIGDLPASRLERIALHVGAPMPAALLLLSSLLVAGAGAAGAAAEGTDADARPRGIPPLEVGSPAEGWEAFLDGAARECDGFRRGLLAEEEGAGSRARLVAGATVRFREAAGPKLAGRRGVDGFRLGADDIERAIAGSARIPGGGAYGEFGGKWYGKWSQSEVDHHWGDVVEPAAPRRVPGDPPLWIRSWQYAWIGDGYGVNIVATTDPRDGGADFLLGHVVHLEDGDLRRESRRRPHAGVAAGPGKLIWITKEEVFLEESYRTADGAEEYAITGFHHGTDGGALAARDGFQAVYTRSPGRRPAFFTFPVSLGEPALRAELIFPLHPLHNHAPGIVELPDGDLLVSWYRGSGERRADDVAVYGARLEKGESRWSDPFLLADTPGFPDCNTAMHLGADGRLWLFWPTVIANTWESCITNYRISRDFQGPGPPRWEWQGVILLEPLRFQEKMQAEIAAQTARAEALGDRGRALIEEMRRRVGEKLSRRLGWQPRCKPTVLPSGRMLLPLYSDTYSVSVMAITDDGGKTWQASEPLAGFGAIQPSVLRRRDGTLAAYLRENGPLDRVRVAESRDDGVSWGAVGAMELPNPGSGLDGIVLGSGRWLLIHNDTTSGRASLAASVSRDEGRTWKTQRHLERHASGQYHYPAVIQARDGTLHAVYTYTVQGGSSMKHAAFPESWLDGERSL